MGKYSSKDLTKDLLLLAGLGLVIPVALIAPGLPLAIKPFLKRRHYYPSEIKKTINRLQTQKLISINYQEKETKMELLEKGRKRVLSYEIEKLKLSRGKWDGIWRVVIFDIPEKKRGARDFLRSMLKELGFYKLQKSVLVTPWECRDIVDFVKHYYFVGDYVTLISTSNLEQENYLKKYFNL
ncbi:hypothetical protein HYW44_01130 [Candidatus Daviesbacteria bacterium]|nr:hypothetical protein [Candidatus Daviesbacteria bacterium]